MSAPAADPPVRHGGDIHDLLYGVVVDAKRLSATLEELIEHPRQRQATVVRRTSITGSSPSWHAQAAYLVLDLSQLSRRLESDLRNRISEHCVPRGTSDHNTILALEALPALAHTLTREGVWDVWQPLEHWCSRARIVVGEIEPLTLLPRQPGQREPRCPWCRSHTLRYQRYAGTVRCVNPSCADASGHRPIGRIEIGRISGDSLLIWRDGSAGLPDDE
jgi:hypothetical protein